MRNFKKIASVVLAAVMTLAMTATAFAARIPQSDGTGAITVTNAQEGVEYRAYRLFDLTGVDDDEDGDYDRVSYEMREENVSLFIGDTAPLARYLIQKTADNAETYKDYNILVYNETEYFIVVDEDNVASFAQDVLTNLADLFGDDYDGSATCAEGDTSVEISGLDLGYYLVYPKGAVDETSPWASICSLTSTVPEAEITAKAELPTITKEVDKKDVEVGETVTFTINGKVPDTTGYDEGDYTYIISDTMTEGLTFDAESLTVSINGTDLTDDDYVTVTPGSNGFSVQIDVTQFQGMIGQTILVRYEAQVNSDAVVTLTTNSASLEYSNSPFILDDTEETPDVIEEVYTSKIVINKYDANNTDKKLADAHFVLANADGDYYHYDSTTDVVSWVDIGDVEPAAAVVAGTITEKITVDDGSAEFIGVKDGTYTLYETVAPTGYNRIMDGIEVVVAHTTSDDLGIGVAVTSNVANNSGILLPSTGGTGTTMLYALGGILVAGACAFFATRKKRTLC